MKGTDVKRILKACGYTQSAVAKSIGMNQQTMSEALKSDNIRIELLKQIAKAIDKDVAFFFNEVKTDSKQIELLYEATIKLYYDMRKMQLEMNSTLFIINTLLSKQNK